MTRLNMELTSLSAATRSGGKSRYMLGARKEIKPKGTATIPPMKLQEVLIFESDRILQVNRHSKQKQFVSVNCYREYGATTHFMVGGWLNHRHGNKGWLRDRTTGICMVVHFAIKQKD